MQTSKFTRDIKIRFAMQQITKNFEPSIILTSLTITFQLHILLYLYDKGKFGDWIFPLSTLIVPPQVATNTKSCRMIS
jgi:hypothetical protein